MTNRVTVAAQATPPAQATALNLGTIPPTNPHTVKAAIKLRAPAIPKADIRSI